MRKFSVAATLIVFASIITADADACGKIFGRFRNRQTTQATATASSCATCDAAQVAVTPAPVVPAADPFDGKDEGPKPAQPTKVYVPRGHHLPHPPAGKAWTLLVCSPAGCEYILTDKK